MIHQLNRLFACCSALVAFQSTAASQSLQYHRRIQMPGAHTESFVGLTNSGFSLFETYEGISAANPAESGLLIGRESRLEDGRIIKSFSSVLSHTSGIFTFIAGSELAGGGDLREGLYLVKDRLPPYQLAIQGQPAPSGGVFDFHRSSDWHITPDSDGDQVVFVANTGGGPGQGVYLASLVNGSIGVQALAVIGSPAPGGGAFTRFYHASVTTTGAVFFTADTTTGYDDFYSWENGSLALVSRQLDEMYWYCSDSGAITYLHDLQIGTFDRNGSHVIYRQGDPTPDGGTLGNLYPHYDFSVGLGNPTQVAFTGSYYSASGVRISAIFQWSSSGLKIAAKSSDLPPGGGFWRDLINSDYQSAHLRGVQPLVTPDGTVYFRASTTGGASIFKSQGGRVERIVGKGDVLDGVVVNDVFMTGSSNIHGQFVYHVMFDGDPMMNGFYLYPYVGSPEIQVFQSKGAAITSGKSSVNFGTLKKGARSTASEFVIVNSGDETLSGLGISVVGNHKSDFVLSGLSTRSLAPGQKATFKVGFRPKSKGLRKAVIQIKSNDKDENPFLIRITGRGR